MSPSRTSCHAIAFALTGLWLMSVTAMSIAVAATPLYQPGMRLGLCTPCAAIAAHAVVAKKPDPVKAG